MTNLESKVTSLPLSRKLAAAFKEKGIKPPESEFVWDNHSEFGEGYILTQEPEMADPVPAYLSDELLEGMPQKVEKDWLVIKKLGKSFWTVQYGDRPWEESIVLSYACARMTLWLIDNGYYE